MFLRVFTVFKLYRDIRYLKMFTVSNFTGIRAKGVRYLRMFTVLNFTEIRAKDVRYLRMFTVSKLYWNKSQRCQVS